MSAVIDADTHVLEPAEMWEGFDPAMYARRPVRVSVPTDTVYGKANAFWLIDGNIFPKPAGKGGFLLATPAVQENVAHRDNVKACELLDLDRRLRDMDAMGVDVQVIYPTLFLPFITDDVELEIALCQSYNRFLAAVWCEQPARLRWVLIPPLRSIEATIRELRYGKEHGAVGVFFRGIERDRTLDDPYFFPVYEEASHLDLPICVHTGAGCPDYTKVIDVTRSSAFPHGRMLPLVAFRNIVANDIPQQFPELRFAFVETGASWVPYVLHNLRSGRRPELDSDSRQLFEECRLFVSYEVAEDLGYLLQFVGEDHIFAGSDYAHTDPSSQLRMVPDIRAKSTVPATAIDKILGENARRLYGI